MVKKIAFALVLAGFAVGTAQAGPIKGSQDVAFAVDGTADLDTVTSITFNELFLGASGTLDYTLYTGPAFESLGGPYTLDLAIGSAFTFGSAAFGTFTGTVVVDDNSAINGRTVYLTGVFTPGTDSGFTGAGLTQNTASLVFSFNQSGGVGNTIGGGGSMNTPAQDVPGVPEPSTAVALVSGLAFAGFVGLRRKAAR